MQAIKAVCKCKGMSESNTVVAVLQGRLEGWGCLTWIFNALMTVFTLGFWLFFVAGWVFASPRVYRCQSCNAVVDKKQFRS